MSAISSSLSLHLDPYIDQTASSNKSLIDALETLCKCPENFPSYTEYRSGKDTLLLFAFSKESEGITFSFSNKNITYERNQSGITLLAWSESPDLLSKLKEDHDWVVDYYEILPENPSGKVNLEKLTKVE